VGAGGVSACAANLVEGLVVAYHKGIHSFSKKKESSIEAAISPQLSALLSVGPAHGALMKSSKALSRILTPLVRSSVVSPDNR